LVSNQWWGGNIDGECLLVCKIVDREIAAQRFMYIATLPYTTASKIGKSPSMLNNHEKLKWNVL
jgi:hypothetical protein